MHSHIICVCMSTCICSICVDIYENKMWIDCGGKCKCVLILLANSCSFVRLHEIIINKSEYNNSGDRLDDRIEEKTWGE